MNTYKLSVLYNRSNYYMGLVHPDNLIRVNWEYKKAMAYWYFRATENDKESEGNN